MSRDKENSGEGGGNKNWIREFLHPVVVIAVLILVGVLFLLFCAIFGIDKGVLAGMSKPEYARGLITYLFAVVTIGTAVVLVVSALISKADDQHEKQFQRGKEILSLLLGVFGTIVGFYFGSEVSKRVGAEEVLHVAPIHLSSPNVAPNAKFTIETVVTGGQAPYHYSVGFDRAPIETKEEVGENGKITAELTAPALTEEKSVAIEVRVQDGNGHVTDRFARVMIKPSH